MEDSLKKRYFIKLASSMINGLINIVLIAIVPKALGPVVFGQFSYLQQFFSQVIAFLDAGTSTAFFTKLSARHERKELISFYFLFSALLLLILLSFVAGLQALDYSAFFLPKIPSKYIYFGLWFGFLTWLMQIYIKISDAYALTVSVELVKIVHKILSLLLLLFMMHRLVFDLTTYFSFHYISLLSFMVIISVLFLRKDILHKKMMTFDLSYRSLTREFYLFSSPLFVFNIIAIAVALFDTWLLQYVSGSTETGFYGLAYSIAAICFLFTGAMTPLITREFSRSHAQKDVEHLRKLFKRYIPMLYAIAAFFGVFISFESENLITIFAGENFQGAALVLTIMAFYPLHQTYGQLSGSLFFAMEETRLYRNIGLVVSLSGLVLTYGLLYVLQLGAVGLAWKMVLIQLLGVNIQLYYNTRALHLRLLPFVLHQGASALFFVVMAFVSTHLFLAGQDGIIPFLVQGGVYTILSLLGIRGIPSILASDRDEMQKLIASLKSRWATKETKVDK